jgi:chemotaxis methyl-accepting protein methylase
VTSFARDAAVFDALARIALPSFRTRPEGLRVWSAGCADGSELYSVAILLAEAGLLERSSLLGTDCRPGALEQARAACYRADGLRDLSEPVRDRYFEARDGGLRPIVALRRAATWALADVTSRPQAGPWHLILCRNLAIYLTEEEGRRLWRRLAGVLAPGGFIVTGKAEPRHTTLARIDHCLYRKPWAA